MRISRLAALAAVVLLSGCAVFQPKPPPANLDATARHIIASTGAIVASAAPHRYGLKYGAIAQSGGSEVGSFQNAAPLSGSERFLADQAGVTVNITPTLLGQYFGIPSGLVFPLSIANGGNGTASPTLTAGANVTLTGSWPNYTIAASSASAPCGSNYQLQYNNSGSCGAISLGTAGLPLTSGGSSAAPAFAALNLSLSGAVSGQLPAAYGGTGLSALGTGVATGLGTNVGSAGAFTVYGGVGNFSSIVDSGISASTSPICPNGSGGAFTTSGCATSGVTLQTGGTNNSSQTALNLVGVGNVAVTNPSGSTVDIGPISEPVNPQIGTTYTIATTDCGKQVTFTNASAIAVTVPQANGSFTSCQFDVTDIGAGTATLTPSTSTINGGSSLAVATSRQCTVNSDGTNWQVIGCTALVSGSGGTTENVQVFTTSGTWTKPSGSPQVTSVLCIGGGGGGGSGGFAATSTAVTGGGGGGGGSFISMNFPTASLTSTVTVTIGGGGTGGAAITSAGTGNYGGGGGTSTFGSYLSAYGGGGGQGGAASTASSGGGGGGLMSGAFHSSGGVICGPNAPSGATGLSAICQGGGATGGGDASTGSAGTNGGQSVLGGSGGGAGAGLSSTDATSAGGNGGAANNQAATTGGAAGSNGNNGVASSGSAYAAGSAGSGGGSSSSGTSGTGGTGSIGSGGGGGGGADTTSSGAGGNGGGGECVAVTTY